MLLGIEFSAAVVFKTIAILAFMFLPLTIGIIVVTYRKIRDSF